MPVRFLCPDCHQLLSVGRRKIGSRVNCPKCDASITVPAIQEAEAMLAMAKAAPEPKKPLSFSDIIALDEPPQPYKARVASRVPPIVPPPPLPPSFGLPEIDPAELPAIQTFPAIVAPTPAARDANLVSFPRRRLYVLAVLMGIVALLAFGLGYLSGRIGQPADRAGAPAQRELVEPQAVDVGVGGK